LAAYVVPPLSGVDNAPPNPVSGFKGPFQHGIKRESKGKRIGRDKRDRKNISQALSIYKLWLWLVKL